MLAYSFLKRLLRMVVEVEPQSVIDNEEDLDTIIDAISEKPPKHDLELVKETPIVSENEGFRCQERTGVVTSISTHTGLIDDQFIFDLEEHLIAELKVGTKVAYLAYRLCVNEEWRVKNITVVYDEDWGQPEEEAADEEAADEEVVEEIGPGVLLGESAVLEKTLVCRVQRREGRIAVMDNNVQCDLNTTTANFTPLTGDYVALDVIVQVQEDAFDFSGKILEVNSIRPARSRKVECVVTLYDQRTRTGTVDNGIFFQREFCSPGFVPSRGDKVMVEAIESEYGGMNWRALLVEPSLNFQRPTVPKEEREADELNNPQLFKDKEGVFLSKTLDFGTLEMGERRVLEFVIENGGTKPVRIESIQLVRAASKQLTFSQMPVVPRALGAGAMMRINISCLAQVPGHHIEVVLVEMEGFKIARRIFLEVKSSRLEAATLDQGARKRYNYTSNREEACRRQKERLESELQSVPGVPIRKSPAFVAFRIPSNDVPSVMWDILNTPRSEVKDKIFEKAPMFLRDLDPTTYTPRFRYLLWLAEAEGILELRRYDMKRVKFDRKGEYLSLTVPGLAESRPSLLVGDRVEAISPFIEARSFTGVIHRVLKTEVYLRFDQAFHLQYNGEDYSVCFLQNRGYWKKCHYAVHKVVQSLGTQWLFPTGVTGKPAQIKFEEDTCSPQPQPQPQPLTLASSSSDEEKQRNATVSSTPVLKIQHKSKEDLTTKIERNESSSTDEGYIQKITEKKDSDRPLIKLLSMVKEEKSNSKVLNEGSDTEVSSVFRSSQDSVLESKTQSPVSSERSARLTSDSDTSDAEKSGCTVKKSPREGLRKGLQYYANRGSNKSSPVLNGDSQLSTSTSTSSANISVNGQNGSTDASKIGQENSPSVQNGPNLKLRCLRWINQSLNSRQKDAVRNVLRGEARPLPYIIFGPPGTGKTMTLVEAILQIYLLMPDSRILIATPSNSAANLITERLLDSKLLKAGELVRLVSYTVVDNNSLPQRLAPYCALVDINAQAPLQPEIVSNIPVMSAKSIGRNRITVTTCVSAGQLFYLELPKDHFTHIVMDEAGQATEPEAMNPLAFLSRKNGQAILAGDPLQLGPVVPSKLAEELGLGVSFLARILRRFPYNRDIEGFPETAGYDPRLVTKLIYNYRSLPSILHICSEMFYDSELIPTLDGETSSEAQILNILTETLKIPRFGVVFQGVRGDDNQEADCPSWFNLHEVIAVLKYVAELSKLGIRAEDIGIITPYRKQVQKMRSAFEDNGAITIIPKIGTVEEFQGQERLIIIVSTVRSSAHIVKADQKHHLGFVACPQRLNVAISRAKALLIVVGNPLLLCYDTYWKSLFEYCYQNGSYIGCNPPPYVVGTR